MPRLVANGLRFQWEQRGAGQRVLFLGGTGWDLRQSPHALDLPLTEHFDVLLFDQRGMGRSDKPPGPYTMADYARDAVGVMDALDWNEAHVIGYSFGGMVAQEVAIRAPQRVRKLVLAATTAGGAGGASYPIDNFIDLEPRERARRGLEVADLCFTRTWQAENPLVAEERILARMRRQMAFRHEPRAFEGLVAQLAARSGHDAFDRLAQIYAPTLVIAGRNDGQAPKEACAAMAREMSASSFLVVDGTHNFLFENNQAIEAVIDHLLGK